MTRRRWIADEVQGDRAILLGSNAEHLARVLRARVGQDFDVSTGASVRRGKISAIDLEPPRVEFDLGEEISVATSVGLTLVLAIFKFDRMEWAIEKCTELGATRFVPVIARRTEAHLAKGAAKRTERWRKIAHQAAQQSRRAAIPEVETPVKLKDIVQRDAAQRILLSENEENTMLRDAIQPSIAGEILIAAGPEGGWTGDELALFGQSGWIAASLGPTILRAETAAIAATALVISEML
jgi:16S rRNA (uracil1498-N3)-methyltransferase